MAFKDQISKDMPVIDATGRTIGVVDGVEGERIKLTRKDSPDGEHHYVPLSDVARVDEHVHLQTAGLAEAAAHRAQGERDEAAYVGGISKVLPWAILALALLIGALWLSGSFDGRDDGARGITDTGMFGGNETTAVAPNEGAVPTDGQVIVPGIGTLGQYLSGDEPAPRTFQFDTLNFDTGKSDIREADGAELLALTVALKQNATTRVRVVGYADARGAEPANATLGKARADAVKAFLVREGVDGGRIETASGGETTPVGANETAGGRAENRRTELVVISR